MFLAQIAEYDHDAGRQQLPDELMQSHLFNKELKEAIIDHDVHEEGQHIPEKLYMAAEAAAREHQVFAKHEAYDDTNKRRSEQSRIVGFQHHEACMHVLVMKIPQRKPIDQKAQ